MVSFSPERNFTLPTGLKFCCDYMLNFSPISMGKFNEMQEDDQCTCSHSYFSPFARAENPSPGWDF